MQALVRRCGHACLTSPSRRLRPLALTHCAFRYHARVSLKCRYISSRSDSTVENITVPCGSNGSIQLHVDRYTAPSSLPPPVIIYLPPGPICSSPDDSHVTSILANNIAATVVQLNYRFGADHRFPTPVHDVLFGFDWVVENLLGSRSGKLSAVNDFEHTRVGVFGELVGGGLATMLALTECHTKGYRISAAATNDPILDWVFPETVANELSVEPLSNKRSKKNSKTSFWKDMQHDPILQEMLRSRTNLFRKPDDWFDPFISSTLFFRSAGVEVPKSHDFGLVDEFQELTLLDQKDFLREQLQLSTISNTTVNALHTDDGQGPKDEEEAKKVRKTAKRYPNVGSRLTLPNFYITTGHQGMLHEQAAEFTHLVRRSMVRTDELRDVDPELSIMHAEQRASHLIRDPNQKHWHKGWAEGVAGVAQWFREVL
ncbi:alpha/beta-hydrolase [Myriangium duriaei CBS 260.36]|uniref:Alpha/beta-hydrolase n=1 Tax=Myriangium duriaei CBS 260.36 TaxID=1168546 RepID=A0A9P4JE51_9PEZI|nr:alpha/beta-hydrolase [Myriangium duriaei CBS 260.36]